jgi:hypothetical protein
MVDFFLSGFGGIQKVGVQNRNSHKHKNSNLVETMSIADFVVLWVHPHYSHTGSECPRVEGNDEYTSLIRSHYFDQEGTDQEPNMEMVDKYVCGWMLKVIRHIIINDYM